MELNIKFNEKMLVETANRVLDEFEYNGKTIREWADLIANLKTNADRIRAMTDEELAEWIAGDVLNLTGGALAMATEAWLDWLKAEVSDGKD